MIVLVARYYGKPGQGDAIEAALKQMAPHVAASEPGCLLYHACRSQEHPDQFLLYEQYADEAALQQHRETEHYRQLVEGTILPLLEKRERDLYTLVVGQSPVPGKQRAGE
ncbi:putative quinol monooxygenase [Thermogemmatispora onikobensis]|uniref:putative quinol monooxygenase n=1 Tax=Thermogemmatispora onikobensis TaxID=732234 RepID=UPI0008539056|nr:antibiotic biosynthesis monooxygenase family protein [Thermogemmatispora onikobensis]